MRVHGRNFRPRSQAGLAQATLEGMAIGLVLAIWLTLDSWGDAVNWVLGWIN